MRTSWIVLLALGGCRTITHEPAPDAYSGPELRAATFNVRRFFDTVCDSGACEPGAYEELPSEPELESRAQQIADAVRALDADVISLQEIESQACLDALLSRLTDVMPYGVLGETDTAASVDVAILSRTPIDQVVGHRADTPLRLPNGATTTFSRELLEVHTRAHGVNVVMFAAHFKSKANDEPDRRLAEGQAASQIVDDVSAREPDSLVLLGGDLNDTPDSPALQALTADGGLVRVADDLSAEEQATYIYGGQRQAIDHLLLAPSAASRRIPRSSRTWREGTRGYGGSDHFALTSNFAVDEP